MDKEKEQIFNRWKDYLMGWFYLVLAGICEIFYAAAMPRTDGFTKLWPSLFCAVFIGLSMYLLSLATRSIPVGTAYAVWVGIGAIGTAIYGIVALGEDKSFLRVVCFGLILAGIVGLKLVSHERH
ncbi:DMT family transporter [Oxalicibacterium faecigallinarum]